ncbi:MAG: hypothetical protein KF689_11925 [Gemmatimonadaceae bacterium]|nr:hypothetical protein [Gemmatimonadaceae bacterium]MCW5827312.1 hypothetical protein [Gemmatimonadaceae bacterium]
MFPVGSGTDVPDRSRAPRPVAAQADVRRIAMTLPGTEEETGRFAFSVPIKGKLSSYAWVWLERREPKKARVPNPSVLALRVANLGQKDLMLQADPIKFFTEPHYNGYPAVLLRLNAVRVTELRSLLTEAWRCVALKAGSPISPESPRPQPTRAKKGAG